MNGILLVDKPAGWTSHDVVDQIRRAAGMRKVGHTGTLDPAATGLLILCLGKATRMSEFLIGMDKVYEGTMRMGIITDSHDLDGGIVEERPVPELAPARIEEAFARFTGDIMQVPPMVSAVKINGERLYKKARKGEVVDRPARPVTVREFELVDYQAPDARFRVRCTRGTYARTLCYDVGEVLGCGATLAALRRTWVGPHSVAEAKPAEEFRERADVTKRIRPIESALELPEIVVEDETREVVAAGTVLNRRDWRDECPVADGWVQIKSPSGELLALGNVETGQRGISVHPKRVLCGRR
jgi:tRNA pseudouridine55 synthase